MWNSYKEISTLTAVGPSVLVTTEIVALTSLFHGALHMASFLVAAGVVFVSLAMGVGKAFGILGLLAALGQLLGAYPWLLGPWGTFGAQVLFPAWLAWAGWRLASNPRP